MNCTQCGAEVREDADFCARCGTRLVGYAGQENQSGAQASGGPAMAGASAGPGPAAPGYVAPGSAAPGSAAPGSAAGGVAYRFDANRWTLTDRIAGGATLVVLISLFLPWFTVNLAGLGDLGITSGGSASESGTDAHGWLWFVFVIGLLLLIYLVVAAGYQRLSEMLPLKHERLLLAATGINFLLVLIAFFLMPGNDGIAEVKIGWDFGAVIALIAAIAAFVSPVRDFVGERKTGGVA